MASPKKAEKNYIPRKPPLLDQLGKEERISYFLLEKDPI
jgi:hypothetical protein